MEYMKVLHLSLFVGQLDLTNLYDKVFSILQLPQASLVLL